MNISDVKATAFAMPLTSPAFPRGPYRFINREFLIITYRTDPDALHAVVPEPLEILEPLVRYEFIRMPDSSGFGELVNFSNYRLSRALSAFDVTHVIHNFFASYTWAVPFDRAFASLPKRLTRHRGRRCAGSGRASRHSESP